MNSGNQSQRDLVQSLITKSVKIVDQFGFDEFQKVFDEAGSKILNYLPFEYIKEEQLISLDKVSPTLMLKIMDKMLENYYKANPLEVTKQWKASIANEKDSNNTLKTRKSFAADQSSKTIIVPNQGRNWDVVSVIGHEFVHFIRSDNAERNQIPILTNYLMFEEGLASTIQMLIKSKFNPEGKEPEIIIGGRPYINTLIALLESDKGFELSTILTILRGAKLNEAKYREAFPFLDDGDFDDANLLGRVMRGGEVFDNVDSRAFFPKDISYELGVNLVHKFSQILNSENSALKSAANKINKIILEAKFDPMNYQHIKVMVAEGVLELTEKEQNEYFGWLLKKKDKKKKMKKEQNEYFFNSLNSK